MRQSALERERSQMMLWLTIMMLANAGAIALGTAVKQYDQLLGHTVAIALMFTITLLCVDQMARATK
jgi:heme A synthase